MTRKDWIKGKQTSYIQYYVHKPSLNLSFCKQKRISITKLGDNRGYVVFIALGESSKAIQKDFKTKQQALNYAKKYMKSHSGSKEKLKKII
jgi:hypothetical protein